MTYQPGIPTGTVNLNVDYKAIQTNFTALNTIFFTDHVTFDNKTDKKGYHRSIHFNPISTTVTNAPNNYVQATQIPQGLPATVAGIGQVFSSSVNDGYLTDTGLYFITGTGIKVALTRNFLPSHGANGYTYLPGGIVLQWGFRSVGVSSWTSGSVTFLTEAPATINFTNACLAVFTTFSGVAGASSSSGDIYITAKSTTGFTWNFTTSSNANFNGFYWAAIGY